MHDVIIAGGGPVGLYSARLCGEMGLDYVVIEEHGNIGRPNHCSGLISRNLERFVKINEDFIEHRIRGAILHSGKRSVTLRKSGTAAYVIDREKFDSHLSRGLNIETGTRITGFTRHGDRISLKTNKSVIEAKMLLACDGSNSVIRKQLGFKPPETVPGFIAITQNKNTYDHVELWFDLQKLKNGFIWKIPRGSTTEYGMLGSGSFRNLEDFFGIERYEKRAGTISLGSLRSYSDRILLIGDAACQVKPWSGGGVVYGLKCAGIAAKTLEAAFEREDFSGRFLSRYEREWRSNIGNQIRFGMFYRKLFKRASNRQLDVIFSMMNRIKFLNRLDMDLL